MTTVVIIHGTENNSQGNWFGWLASELSLRGVSVIAPDFPTPDRQNLTNWLAVYDDAPRNIRPEEIVIVGHSTGAVMALRLAERTTVPYAAICAVCPFAEDLGLTPYDDLNSSFAQPPWNWQRVQRGAKHLVLLAGQDDPYVPLPIAQRVATSAHAELIIVENGGHLNAERGFTTFPLLLNLIEPFLNTATLREISI